jgi:hypothetical protein
MNPMSHTRHEWVRWLKGEDAQLLLRHLCEWIDDPTIAREQLTLRIHAYARLAHKAVGAQDWQVLVDPALGVGVDPWLYRFWQRQQEMNGTYR